MSEFARRGVRVPPTHTEAEAVEVVHDVLTSGARANGQTFTEPDDDWVPIYLVLTPQQGTVFTGTADKRAMTRAVADFARRVGAVAIGHLSSTWQLSLKTETPEQRAHADAMQRRVRAAGGTIEDIPGRTEALMLAIYTASTYVAYHAQIDRHDGGPPTLRPFEVAIDSGTSERQRFEGAMVDPLRDALRRFG